MIMITENFKVVDFLDVTFDLTLRTYKPFSKPNNETSYVHKRPLNKRLSKISRNEPISKEAAEDYKEAGYEDTLKFDPKPNSKNK